MTAPALAPSSAVDPDELGRLEREVAEQSPPPPPGAPEPELHDRRTEGEPGQGPTPEDFEQLLSQPLTEEDLRDLLELAFGLIALRRPTRDPITHKLVWAMEPEESGRIAHWATKVINRRAWLKQLAEFFPELMLAVTLLWAGYKRATREQEILEAQKGAPKAAPATEVSGEPADSTRAV